MHRVFRSVFSLSILLIVAVGMLHLSNLVSASRESNHGIGLHNATQTKDDVLAWGAQGQITWTDPDVSKGYASFHRVAYLRDTPLAYAGFGWIKRLPSNFAAVIEWYDNGPKNFNLYSVSKATHRYSIQYDPNTKKHHFYVDGNYVFTQDCKFSFGDRAVAGGEVQYGTEKMGHTKVYQLKYSQQQSDGTFRFVPWNGHTNYVQNAPYFNTNIAANAFYDDP